MKWIKEWIDANTAEGKKSLFVITGILTLIYFALITMRAFWNLDLVWIPPAGVVIYLSLLTAYVGIKEADKIKNGDNAEKKKGELFFMAWMTLAGTLWLLGGLHKGNAALVLQENLSTVLTVSGLYVGAEGRKLVASILSTRQKKKKEQNS